jgi:hypothetical protein
MTQKTLRSQALAAYDIVKKSSAAAAAELSFYKSFCESFRLT